MKIKKEVTVKAIQALIDKGKTRQQIAETLGVNRRTIWEIMRSNKNKQKWLLESEIDRVIKNLEKGVITVSPGKKQYVAKLMDHPDVKKTEILLLKLRTLILQ